MDILIGIIGAALGLLLGGLAGSYFGRQSLLRKQQERATNLLLQAEEKARNIIEKASNDALRALEETERKKREMMQETDAIIARRRKDVEREEEGLQRRRESLDKRSEELEKRLERAEQREQALNKRQAKIDKREQDLQKKEEEKLGELQRIAQMTVEEAKAQLLAAVEQEARNDMARIIRQIEAEAREEGERRAREIIGLAIQRLANEHVNEVAVSVVPLPSDEMKGRIIGRNGRNIRAFEVAAGVDVVVDDTPETITISSFDPIRREVARISMSKLVTDGRIHPARIEKLIQDTRAEIDRVIREEGERAAYVTGIHGLHPEILRLLGQLKFRTSYGQNQHAHSIETAHLAGMIAAELGADVMVAKMGGLLHDIGKAIDHETEGTHARIGADLLRRYRIDERVINCVEAHHHEVEQLYVEAYIVEAADAISGARPGARRESIEAYIKRVKALEDIANSYQGVEQSYALQAGREVRIIVRPEEVDDLGAMEMARSIAKQIEETMQYPGQIKVHVIREKRAIEFAK
ncbi:MAG: ribonuclease Y [Anaerolineae bacterium]|nr:ribonuclease Y [Anaerolineae bacterium]MDW8173854.1 ribonuclease Y [Anaerolineae bacterium]